MAWTKLATVACVVASLASTAQSEPTRDATSETAKRESAPEGYYVPAYYPAPYGGWVDEWKESYEKAKKLVDSMILAEKTNITAGTGIFMGKSDQASGSADHLHLKLRMAFWRAPPIIALLQLPIVLVYYHLCLDHITDL